VLRSRRFYEKVAVAAIVLGALRGIGHDNRVSTLARLQAWDKREVQRLERKAKREVQGLERKAKREIQRLERKPGHDHLRLRIHVRAQAGSTPMCSTRT
jgi:hypothetical protein